MITFLAALAFICFWDTSLATRVSVGSFLFLMFVLVVILLYLDWEGHANDNDKSLLEHILPSGLKTALGRLREKWHPPKWNFTLHKRTRSSASSINSDNTMVG